MPKDRKDRLPWFRFHVDRYLLDTTEEKFDLQTEGLYIRLLCYQWRRGIIPAGEPESRGKLDKKSTLSREDLEKISTLCRVRVDLFSRLWNDHLCHKFEKVEGGYVNRRLEEERQSRVRFEVMAEGRARKGGLARSELEKERRSESSLKLANKIKNKDKDKETTVRDPKITNRQDLKVVVQMARAVRAISSNGFPDFKNKPSLWSRWIAEARLLREKDGRDPEITLSLIAGLRAGEFKKSGDFDWANNIKHPGKFREENRAGETYWEVLNNERDRKNRGSRVSDPKRSKFRRIREAETKGNRSNERD